jgi:hypothetical protein
MKTFSPLRFGLASLAVVSLAILVTAAPAAAREFDMVGLSTNEGCNAGVPVKFTVKLKHGHFKHVTDFKAKGFNYPNKTPPVPVGDPTGHCYPGETGWSLFTFKRGTTEIPFGEGDAEPNEFLVDYSYHGIYEEYIAGFVKVQEHADGRFKGLKAHGVFTYAVSEGGLQYGGSSTGDVKWKAKDD